MVFMTLKDIDFKNYVFLDFASSSFFVYFR